MNPVSRGVRNAFRNGIRTGSIVLILGLSIGLSLTMLIAQKAVDHKIANVKRSIGNVITVSPAGFNPGTSANNALTIKQLDKVKSLANVTSVSETLSDHETTTGTEGPSFGRFGDSNDDSERATTSLNAPIVIGKDGPRFFAGGVGADSNASFSLPVEFLGTSTPSKVNGTTIILTKGTGLNGTSATNDALISQAMATKNNLSVGSTFTAYNATLTVKGIFKSSSNNQGVNNTVVLSLPAMQRLSSQSGVVTGAEVTVNSLDNLSSVTKAVKSTLGSNADVVSEQEQADNTVKPLSSVKTVSTFSLIGAIVAGAVIILLTMIMVVRERKKEIGVAKAIGGSNLRIVSEFMVESLTLAVLGAIIGLFIGVVGGQPVTKMLVDNSTSSSDSAAPGTGPAGTHGLVVSGNGPGGGPAGNFSRRISDNSAARSFKNIKAEIGPNVLLEGFGAAVFIAVLGSALAAGMISKVRPSTVMRTE